MTGRVRSVVLYGLLSTALCALIVLAGLKFSAPLSASEDDTIDPTPRRVFVEIATGSLAGTYLPVGRLLAQVVSQPLGAQICEEGGRCGVPGLTAVARVSEGSVRNVRSVNVGLMESALAQADVVSRAFHGDGTFKDQPLENVRAIANLYPEVAHIVVLRSLEAKSVKDLKGRRISIDRPGSGVNIDSREVLKAYKIRTSQVDLFEVNADTAAEMMLAGELDAFFFIGGTPVGSVMDLAERGLVDLLPLNDKTAQDLIAGTKYFQTTVIPAETYPGIEAVETASVGALWIVGADLSDDLVYAITKALHHPDNRATLDSGHLKGQFISLERSVEGVPIPFHPGAERFYREQGLLREVVANEAGAE